MSHAVNPFRTWLTWSLATVAMGAALCAALAWDEPKQLWPAYLAAYMLLWPVTLGAAGLLAIGNLTGGRWALAARPHHLAVVQTIPLVAVLFLPIALHLESIYPWVSEANTIEHPLPPSKAAYLESAFFTWRAVGYLTTWLVVIGLLNYVSRSSAPPGGTPAMRRVGALSLVLLAPTATFAAFDWGMSLEPEWYSSIYGAIVIAAGVLAAHALGICSLVDAKERYDWAAAAAKTSEHHESDADPAVGVYNDTGNLLLAFLMVFSYFAFSQFLIIWSANLPSEITWYLARLSGGWQLLSLLMVSLLVVAFFQLLSRDRKRTPQRLRGIAVLVLLAYAIHTIWAIVPAFHQSGVAWIVTNLAAMATLGGVWMTAYCWLASRTFKLDGKHPPTN